MFIFSKQSNQEFIDFTDIAFGGGQTKPQIDANADFATLDKNNKTTIKPLDNDTADTTLDSITTEPQHGTATINGNSIDYTPNKDYVGKDLIKYKIKDADGNEDEGSIFIYVAEVLPKPTICDSSPYKCKIIANKGNQGVGVIFDNKIVTTIANNSNAKIELQNGNTVESLDKGASKDIKCGTQPYFELFKLYSSKVNVKAITSYPISFDDDNLAVDIYNKTGSDKYIYRNNGNQVISDNGSYVIYKHCKMIANVGDENNVYVEPSRPPIPTPAHYSDVKINNAGSYRIQVDATSQFDCNVVNNTATDIQDALVSDTSIAETFTKDNAKVITDNYYFAINADKLTVEYTEPTRPPQPTPAHYSDITINSTGNYRLEVVASSSEDCKVTNAIGADIFDVVSGDTKTETITNNANIVMTNDRFFANSKDGLSTVYSEPTRPAQPTPAHYSNFIVKALSDNIDVTATSSEDCDIINQTGGDIKVGDTTVSNNSDLVITANKTITLP